MDELTIRLAFGFAGLVLGHILGWTSRAAIDARAVRKAVMTEPVEQVEPAGRRRWRPTRTDVVLLILIAISLFSGFAAWGQYERNNELAARNAELTARVDRMATCTAKVLADLLRATHERTTYTEESARRNVELQQAQRSMLTTILTPGSTRDQRREALTRYADALDAFQDVLAKAAQQRRDWPYPTQEEIDACRT